MATKARRLKLAELFRLMADCAPVMVWVADPLQNRTYVNRPWLEFTGRKFKEELGRGWVERVHPEDRARVLEIFERSGRERRHFGAEYRLLRRDGEHRWILDKGAPIVSPDGVFLGFVGSSVDISARRRAEEAVAQREQEFKQLAESIPDVIARLDRDLRFVYANPAIETAFSRKPSDFIGRRLPDSGLPELVLQPGLEAVRATFSQHLEHRFGFDVGEAEGTRHYIGRVIPEMDAAKEVVSVLVILYDVTLRTQRDRQRSALLAREQSARAHAEMATLARDQFLAIVSHELRSPLNGIQSWTHVLENHLTEATPGVRRALAGIKIGVDQQVRLIEDLLDATRVMSGNFGLAKQAMALRPAVESAVEGLRALADEKGIAIESHFAIEAQQIDGDQDRIQQVVRNLIANAIKFARSRIWVTATSDGSTVMVTVQDDGAGIPPEFLPFLFEPFRQAEARANQRGQDGLGLGLTLVQRIVELHGGHVTGESHGENMGATFKVFLPLRVGRSERTLMTRPEDTLPGTTTPSLSGLRILLVDDQKEARESVAELLTQSGATVVTAASGREATDWLEKSLPADYPDALVCDIAMPEEDGYATLKRIRGWELLTRRGASQRIPAIALTAFTERKDRIRALAEGFQMHVTKPVAPIELIVVVSSVARGMQV